MTTIEGRGSPSDSKRAKLDDVELLQNTLSENDVGILEYMYSKNAGFKGTLKGRHVTSFVKGFIGGKILLYGRLIHPAVCAVSHQLYHKEPVMALRLVIKFSHTE